MFIHIGGVKERILAFKPTIILKDYRFWLPSPFGETGFLFNWQAGSLSQMAHCKLLLCLNLI